MPRNELGTSLPALPLPAPHLHLCAWPNTYPVTRAGSLEIPMDDSAPAQSVFASQVPLIVSSLSALVSSDEGQAFILSHLDCAS